MSAEPALLAEFTGTLIADAQARCKAVDAQGHMVAMIVMDVRLDNAARHNHLRVEKPLHGLSMAVAETAARRYTKGTRVTVQAPVAWLHIKAENTKHIHVLQPKETTA